MKLDNREVHMVSGIASYLALSTVSQSHMQCRLASRRYSRGIRFWPFIESLSTLLLEICVTAVNLVEMYVLNSLFIY